MHKPAEDGMVESRFLRLDSSRARAMLGWRPRLGTRKALAMTAEWYTQFYRDGNDRRMRELTARQIEDYEGFKP